MLHKGGETALYKYRYNWICFNDRCTYVACVCIILCVGCTSRKLYYCCECCDIFFTQCKCPLTIRIVYYNMILWSGDSFDEDETVYLFNGLWKKNWIYFQPHCRYDRVNRQEAQNPLRTYNIKYILLLHGDVYNRQ